MREALDEFVRAPMLGVYLGSGLHKHRVEVFLIEPLRKQTRDGKLYKRVDDIEAKLVQLESLSRKELVDRCKIRNREDANHVPAECLLYFVRAIRTDSSNSDFEELYKLLVERVLRGLPNADNADGTLSLAKSEIREKAFDRFVFLLASDRRCYNEKLDYFEIRFDGALANLRRDAQEQVWRDENRSATLELDETGELSPEVERAARKFAPFSVSELETNDYRSRLDAAIETLPQEHKRIVEMIRQGIPIDSTIPDAVTIAKVLKKSEKTVRTHRDKAYAKLRAALTQGEKL